ncbi:MAG: sodium:proton antiporter [Chloroflexi bacterium]|nr:sodium:proton antiporter [Chloroflexota bacterium]
MNERYDSVILHFIARVFLVPLIIVFGIYVLLHGELSPGGGFQAGAIVAAALLLVRLTLGNRQGALRIPQGLLIWLACIGLGVYMFGGILPLILGDNFLDYARIPVEWYNQFAGEPRTARSMGIFIIEVGVFFGVVAVLVLIYDLLAGSSRQ